MLDELVVLVAGLAEAAIVAGPEFLQRVTASGQRPERRNLSCAIEGHILRFFSVDHPDVTQEALISRTEIPDPNMGGEPTQIVLHGRNVGEIRKFVCHLNKAAAKFFELDLDEVGLEVLLKSGAHPVLLIGTESCPLPFTMKGRIEYRPIIEGRSARWEGKRILAHEREVLITEKQRRWLDSYATLKARPKGSAPKETRPRSHPPDSAFALSSSGPRITAIRNPKESWAPERPLAMDAAWMRYRNR